MLKRIIVISTGAFALVACADETNEQPLVDAEVADSEIEDEPDPWEIEPSQQEWSVGLQTVNRIEGTGAAYMIVNGETGEPTWFADDGNCEGACSPSPDAQLFLSTNGDRMRISAFDPEYGVGAELLTVDQVVSWSFSEESRLFYTAIQSCEGDGCDYGFGQIQWPSIVSISTGLSGAFPPEKGDQRSLFSGHVTASRDGHHAVLINPSLSGLQLGWWSAGANTFTMSEEICASGETGECVGAGSEYSDSEAIAISADGALTALFIPVGNEANIFLYEDPRGLNASKVTKSTVTKAPDGTRFVDGICINSTIPNWAWQEVIKAEFTRDGEELVILTKDECPLDGLTRAKARTNLVRIKTERLRQGGQLNMDDFFVIMDNPRGDIGANRSARDFTLSPDDGTIYFVATPAHDQNGNPTADGQAAQQNGSALYRVQRDGTGLEQLLYDPEFSLYKPMVFIND